MSTRQGGCLLLGARGIAITFVVVATLAGCEREAVDSALVAIERAERTKTRSRHERAPEKSLKIPEPVPLRETIRAPLQSPSKLRVRVQPGRRRKVRVMLQWARTRKSKKYEVQIAKDVCFGEVVTRVQPRKPRSGKILLDEGVYFWRVRAIGSRGMSSFSLPCVLEAFEPPRRGGGRRRKLPGPLLGHEPTEDALVLLEHPRPWAVYATSAIVVAGTVSEPSRVRVGHGRPKEVTTRFAVPYVLNIGRSKIRLSARSERKKIKREIIVFSSDPDTIQALGSDLDLHRASLRNDLARLRVVEAAADALSTRVKLEAQESRKISLKGELEDLLRQRATLDRDVQATIETLHAMLQRS